MKFIGLKSIVFIIATTAFLNVHAQKTFTVVCDKTDNTVKIVDSEMKSPNYVPIKGGFPFQQLAQKWIKENYTTTTCNPGKLIKDIQKQIKATTPSEATPPPPPPSRNKTSVSGLGKTGAFKPLIRHKNTSFIIGLKFSNLGEGLLLSEKMLPGAEIGMEQLIGGKFYFGTGALFNVFFPDVSNSSDIDPEVFYFGRIPAFVGYRIKTNNLLIMYEGGVHINTRLASMAEDKQLPGQTGENHSVDLMGRFKIGTESILLEVGVEKWLTKIFKNNEFNLSCYHLGVRFYF
ncbi:MAG: hypothetical protein CR996_01630 [Draconibacterium sp.]|nr:MAG: hypothetical protein CR996_01630 [Draconibacterium sp.]PIF05139.1 MAG: hypothetical protein CSA36_08315 [Draconibacterium sp.]